MGYGRTNSASSVEVEKPKLTSIAVTTQPTTTLYDPNTAFNKSGMIVTAYFDDGSSSVVTGYTYSPTTVTSSTTSITISYTQDDITKTTTVAVKVRRYLYNLGTLDSIAAFSGEIRNNGDGSRRLGYNWGVGRLYTTNTINLSNYTKLYVVHHSPVGTSYGGFGITTSAANASNLAAENYTISKSLSSYTTLSTTSGQVTVSLNLANVSGNYYIALCSGNNGSSEARTNLYKMWLE